MNNMERERTNLRSPTPQNQNLRQKAVSNLEIDRRFIDRFSMWDYVIESDRANTKRSRLWPQVVQVTKKKVTLGEFNMAFLNQPFLVTASFQCTIDLLSQSCLWATEDSVKLESFHEARFNFFLSSVEADPADFEVVPGRGLVF